MNLDASPISIEKPKRTFYNFLVVLKNNNNKTTTKKNLCLVWYANLLSLAIQSTSLLLSN
jgi:hypothetical protein